MPKVDFANYVGREQAYIKHCLLEEYLPEWAYKVGSAWDGLVYVDGFAGPWQTTHDNYADTSFGVAIETLRQCQFGLRESRGRDLPMQCILIDRDKDAFAQLKKFASVRSKSGFEVHALHGEFVERIGDVEALIKRNTRNAFRFVFLDPKGWADIPMKKLQTFLRGRSCEVLINLMTRHILRFLDEPDRKQSYLNLFERSEVLEILRAARLKNDPSYALAQEAVGEYGRSLRLLCGFNYVSAAVILEPDEESIRYFLVYATNHPRGVEVFKNAERKASRIQDEVRHQTHVRKTRQPEFAFDEGPPSSKLSSQLKQFYSERARKSVVNLLSSRAPHSEIVYSDLFCEAMTFPLVTSDDLVSWLTELEPHVKLKLDGSARRRKPSPLKDDRVVVITPRSIR
jgi:three-Cys-motif partner protein